MSFSLSCLAIWLMGILGLVEYLSSESRNDFIPSTVRLDVIRSVHRSAPRKHKPLEQCLKQKNLTRSTKKHGDSINTKKAMLEEHIPCDGGPSSWRESFRDEFDYNLTKWCIYNSSGHNGNGFQRPESVQINNGKLVITATEVRGQTVSGGMGAVHAQTYGCYVTRLRVDEDPSLSLNAVALTWPTALEKPGGSWENDFYETLWSKSRKPLFSHFHSKYNGHNSTDRCKNFQAKLTHGDVNASEWHTVAMMWTPKIIKVFIDGKMKGSVTNKCYIPNVEMFVALQLDKMNARRLIRPVKMEVDFVRIYDKIGGYK